MNEKLLPTRYNLVQGFRGGIMQEAADGKYVLFHAYETDTRALLERMNAKEPKDAKRDGFWITDAECEALLVGEMMGAANNPTDDERRLMNLAIVINRLGIFAVDVYPSTPNASNGSEA